MFRRFCPWILLLSGVMIGLVASGRIALHAQDPTQPLAREPGRSQRPGLTERSSRAMHGVRGEAAAPASRDPARLRAASVQDVLLQPFHFSFNRPTSLTQVCIELKQALGVPVVLDIAALERQDVEPEDTVQLELDGVRLKTGLKLLLDQVELTYHVVPEDNLLIITDREGSGDPLDRIWTELRALHRDLHDVQDAVDDLTDSLYGDKEEGPRVRKPTIIEEKPDGNPPGHEPPKGVIQGPKEPAQRPGQKPSVDPRVARPRSSRVPSSGPRSSV